jgi:biotin transport system substrate-specific component
MMLLACFIKHCVLMLPCQGRVSSRSEVFMTIATAPTLADRFYPRTRPARDMILVVGFSLFIAVLAQVSIPLPGGVPLTGQTLAVLLTGMALGSRLGAIAVGAYLIEGSLGLPFFAGGASGFERVLGPTGGYLIGFMLAALIAGWLAERGWSRSFALTLGAMMIANLVIYALGLPWLTRFVGGRALEFGLYPFLVGDVIKAVLAAIALPAAWRLMGGRKP